MYRVHKVPGIAFACLFSVSAIQAQVSATILSPGAGALISSADLSVVVQPVSAYEIAEVRAKVADREQVLAYAGNSRFSGHLSLAGLPIGDKWVLVTTTDALNSTHVDSSKFFWADTLKPTLTIASPRNEAVFNPDMHLKVNCVSAAGGGKCAIKVNLNLGNTLLAQVNDSLDKVYNMATLFPNRQVGVRGEMDITGCDEWQRCVKIHRTFSIDSSEYLSPVATFDAPPKGCRPPFCYIPHGVVDIGYDVLNFESGGKVEIKATEFNTGYPQSSTIAPSGSIFFVTNLTELLEWSGGTVTKLTGKPDSYAIKDEYIAWFLAGNVHVKKAGEAEATLVAMGNNGRITDLRSDGTVTYVYQDSLFRVSGDAKQFIRNVPGMIFDFALGDQSQAVYSRTPVGNTGEYTLAHYGAQGESVLAVNQGGQFTPGPDFQYNNGWVAFLKKGTMDQDQVWLRKPDGEVKQATFFTSSSVLEYLAPTGEFTVTYGGRRYLIDSTKVPRKISGLSGSVFWQDGKWYYLFGGALSEVLPLPIHVEVPTSLSRPDLMAQGAAWIGAERRIGSGLEISVSDPGMGSLRAGLYDHLGRKLLDLGRGTSGNGMYTFLVPTASLGRGVYHLSVKGRGFSLGKRLTITE